MPKTNDREPPLRIVLLAFLATTVLQLPADIIIHRSSVAIGILVDEVVFILLVPILIIRLFGYSPLCLLQFGRVDNKRILTAVCLTLSSALLLGYAKSFSHHLIPVPKLLLEAQTHVMLVYSWGDFFLKLMLLGLLAPACEEILLRGLVQNALASRTGEIRSILITAVFFALIHSTSFQPLLYLLLGFILSWIYAVTRSLRVAIICHAINNAWVLTNNIHGLKFPIGVPPGLLDVALILSGAALMVASLFWLGRPTCEGTKPMTETG